ncbi:acyltransferase [Algoriphagus sp. PAP.12]|uniref:acyltransferase n=1 Tax=Algoriphagus sp. PAP.12 TaxID=2996678 RepID=UPI00227CDB81|nr:acyltransferase [Algoriphagus sp. PAP.12]
MIHPLADVQTEKIGQDTRIWQYAVVLQGAVIGSDCNVNCHTFIENDVIIGDRVTVKSGVYLWDGLTVEDDVFIGPNVTFTNDKYPRSKQYPEEFQRTVIKKGASIGAASVILGGCIIGENSMIAAGSLITKDVPANALVMGRPAQIVRYLEEKK